MIILETERIVLITPNKCASTTLHEVFCHPPWNGLYVVGPQGPWKSCGFDAYPNVIGKHTTEMPFEHRSWSRFIITRDPFDRFISLWKHYCRYSKDIKFIDFVRIVSGYKRDSYYQNWFYTWTMHDYIMSCPEYTFELDLSKLEFLLNEIGLKVSLPQLHKSEREPWQTYYTPALYDMVERLI